MHVLFSIHIVIFTYHRFTTLLAIPTASQIEIFREAAIAIAKSEET
jgi:hypothetical protein